MTHNSVRDFPDCLRGLLAQCDVDLMIVVVDNASTSENRIALERAFADQVDNGLIIDAADGARVAELRPRAVFVRNPRNDGYSAGNNIGSRIAVRSVCRSVLILNPDVRISDRRYVAGLDACLQRSPDCAVCGSRIVGLSGEDENPLRETSIWAEIFWLLRYLPGVPPSRSVVDVRGSAPVAVEKLHGSCLMILSSFVEEIGHLDEHVFLYCEAPILATQVRRSGKTMMFLPELAVLHAHLASEKGNSSRRMLLFISRRLFYLRRYSGHGPVLLFFAHLSYGFLWLLHAIKARLRRS